MLVKCERNQSNSITDALPRIHISLLVTDFSVHAHRHVWMFSSNINNISLERLNLPLHNNISMFTELDLKQKKSTAALSL